MSVAISGASGGLGRRTAEILLEQFDPTQVVLLTRTPDALRDFEKRGIAVRKASFKNPTGLKQVLADVDRLLLISTNSVGDRLEQQRQAIASARIAGVEHIVYTSMAQPSADNPSFVIPDHAGTEQTLRESGMDWTFLRNNVYAEGMVSAAEAAVASGRLLTNAGEGGTAYVSRDDCARVAAMVLATDGHEKTAYDVTGSEAITQAAFAELVTELTGTPIEVDLLSDDAYFDHLIDSGLEQHTADLMSSFGEATRGGFLGKVTTDVADLTGHSPATLEQVLARSLRP